MEDPAAISVCVLTNDNDEAVHQTVEVARSVGAVVLGVVRGAAPAPNGVRQVLLDRVDPVGAAWDRLLRAAPTDLCLLLHSGELLVGPRPSATDVFRQVTIVDQPDPLSLPDRLAPVRLVDRRRCTFDGLLRPVLAVDRAVAQRVREQAGFIVVDAAAAPGPAYRSWIHASARGLDATSDPEELLELAQALAGTEEHDAAIVRLLALLGGLHGEPARRATRLLAFCALRRSRRAVVELAVREWTRLLPGSGLALALDGLSLLSAQRPMAAVRQLEAAALAGFVDDDGVTIDRAWFETALSDAKLRAARLEAPVAAAIQQLPHTPTAQTVIDGWLQLGRPLAELLQLLSGQNRRKVVDAVQAPGLLLDGGAGGELALWLSDHDDWPTAAAVVRRLAERGCLGLEDAVAWSDRLRRARRTFDCPLVLLASCAAVPVPIRVRAAAQLIHRFGDRTGAPLLQQAAQLLHPAALTGVLVHLEAEAPTATPLFVRAASTTATRLATLRRAGAVATVRAAG